MTRYDMDKVLDDIQSGIEDEEAKRFSPKVLREARNPSNVGRLGSPHSIASMTGDCGDTMEFSLIIREDRIEEIRFLTDGCGSSIACGSVTTRIAKGKTIKEARMISERDILDLLGGLPDENEHCARLAAKTLHKALDLYCGKGGTDR